MVFLVDGGSKAFIPSHVPRLRFLESKEAAFPVWLPGKSFDNTLIDHDDSRLRDAAEEEYRRLLYVAMTRAADHLIVCGYRGPKENPDCWHQMIKRALAADENRCAPYKFEAGGEAWEGLLWRMNAQAPRAIAQADTVPSLTPEALPASLMQPLPPGPALPRPLSPSGAGTIVDDGADDLLITSPLFAKPETSSGLALQRGSACASDASDAAGIS